MLSHVHPPPLLFFRSYPQSAVRLVVLPSCKSYWAGEAFVAAGIPHVVCIDNAYNVQDAAVLRFTRALYMSLACGQSVYTAFFVAKQSVASQPDLQVCVHSFSISLSPRYPRAPSHDPFCTT